MYELIIPCNFLIYKLKKKNLYEKNLTYIVLLFVI